MGIEVVYKSSSLFDLCTHLLRHDLFTGLSMALSSVSAFFIWFLKSKTSVIVFEAVFNFIFISGWNGLDIASTEAFPTHIRYCSFTILYWILFNFVFISGWNEFQLLFQHTLVRITLINPIICIFTPSHWEIQRKSNYHLYHTVRKDLSRSKILKHTSPQTFK